MILDPTAPRIETLTKFTDILAITVEAKEKGATFNFDMKRLLPNGASQVQVPLDPISGMMIALESAKQLVAVALGSESPLVTEAEALKMAVVAELKARQEAAKVANTFKCVSDY